MTNCLHKTCIICLRETWKNRFNLHKCPYCQTKPVKSIIPLQSASQDVREQAGRLLIPEKSEKQFYKAISCNVCLDNDKFGVGLRCGHSMCNVCFKRLVTQTAQRPLRCVRCYEQFEFVTMYRDVYSPARDDIIRITICEIDQQVQPITGL